MEKNSGRSLRAELVALLAEDVPALDLTTHWLGIGGKPAEIHFVARQAGVASGIAFAAQLLEDEGAKVDSSLTDGDAIKGGDCLLSASGCAAALHRVWKTALNILEYSSGVASRTALMVARAQAVNPRFGIYATRKMIPGSRPWALRALIDGGGLPHRLGLSETVLIFDQHKELFPSQAELLGHIENHRHLICEKKLLVEVGAWDEALAFAQARVDGLQFDKIEPGVLGDWVARLRGAGFGGICIATGGINAENVAAYAGTGVNGIATSWVYQGPNLDISAKINLAR